MFLVDSKIKWQNKPFENKPLRPDYTLIEFTSGTTRTRNNSTPRTSPNAEDRFTMVDAHTIASTQNSGHVDTQLLSTTSKLVKPRKLIAERMPQRASRPLFVWEEYCNYDLRPQLFAFPFLNLPLIIGRCPPVQTRAPTADTRNNGLPTESAPQLRDEPLGYRVTTVVNTDLVAGDSMSALLAQQAEDVQSGRPASGNGPIQQITPQPNPASVPTGDTLLVPQDPAGTMSEENRIDSSQIARDMYCEFFYWIFRVC